MNHIDKIEECIKEYIHTMYEKSSSVVKNNLYLYKRSQILMYLDVDSSTYDKDFIKYVDGKIDIDNFKLKLKYLFNNNNWKFLNDFESERLKIKNTLSANTNIMCHKCKKKNVFFYEKQMRSADEGTTLFYNCLSCSNKWKQ